MADDKKPAQKAPAPAGKSYRVLFTGIPDKDGNVRRQGEIVTADELADPDFQLRVGAIADSREPAPTVPSRAYQVWEGEK